MSLPTRDEVLQGGYFLDGQPFAAVDANSTVDSLHNGYWLDGQPFVVVSLSASAFPAHRMFLVF